VALKTYVLNCPEQCSLGPGTQVGIQVTEWMLDGKTYRWIVAEVKALYAYTLYPATMTRHKRHITVTGRKADPVEAAQRHKVNNIEILETIIQKGFQNAGNWKPTIADTMKAMDMWFRLTQGNPFDDLLDTLAAAALGEEIEETNKDATGTLDESLVEIDEPEGDLELVSA
jgi:hypothetical protein